MAEKFPVRAEIDRAEQHIGELGAADLAGVEIAHVGGDEIGRDAEAGRLGARAVEHRRAQVESAIMAAAAVPFLEVGRGAAGDLEHPANGDSGKAPYRRREKVDLARDVGDRKGEIVIFRVAVRLHRGAPGRRQGGRIRSMRAMFSVRNGLTIVNPPSRLPSCMSSDSR